LQGYNNQNNNNNNYNGNYQQQYYYVGAYCANGGTSVKLGVFTDAYCTKAASVSTFESIAGFSLPYSSSSIIETECLQCIDTQNNNNNNNNNNNYYQKTCELCTKLYEGASKCESNLMSSSYATNNYNYNNNNNNQNQNNYQQFTEDGCDTINNDLSRYSLASASSSSYTAGSSHTAAIVFAWIFGIAFTVSCAYIYFLRKRIQNGVDLVYHNGMA